MKNTIHILGATDAETSTLGRNKKVLVTGGTVFVSRYVAEYYEKKGYEVYVLNRNNRPQSKGVKLIEADRKKLGEVLKGHHFDIVLAAYLLNPLKSDYDGESIAGEESS